MIPIKVETGRSSRLASSQNASTSKKVERSKLAKKVALVLVSIALIVLGGAFYLVQRNTANIEMRQAVFVTTGQVYFGYVADVNSPMIRIDEAYYLNGAAALMPSNTPQDKISLIKMGSEIYKPMDSVLINRDQIIAIQDISADSQINVAISGSSKSN